MIYIYMRMPNAVPNARVMVFCKTSEGIYRAINDFELRRSASLRVYAYSQLLHLVG